MEGKKSESTYMDFGAPRKSLFALSREAFADDKGLQYLKDILCRFSASGRQKQVFLKIDTLARSVGTVLAIG